MRIKQTEQFSRFITWCVLFILCMVRMTEACTVFVIDGSITNDGRPISGKLRHPPDPDARQNLRRTNRYTLDYISAEWGMGINETGLFIGDSALSVLNPPLSEVNLLALITEEQLASMPYDPNEEITSGGFRIDVLAELSTVDQVREFIKYLEAQETLNVKSWMAVMDSGTDSSMFEINRMEWWNEYHPLNPNRIAQDTYGFVVRENVAHKMTDGTDDLRIINTRCESGRYNIQGMIDANDLSISTLARGTAGPGEGYEFLRYGPGREMEVIAADNNRSEILVHGVLPGEDPLLTTMWLGLGQVNYTILVPTWVQVETIPDPLGAGTNGHMFDRAQSLFSKGNEFTTQQSTFPLEEHIFNEVLHVLLPHWRSFGTPAVDEMTRVEVQMAEDAYSLLHCLDLVRSDNKAPHVDFEILPDQMALSFVLKASDPDGQITSVIWNFGDNTTSIQFSPSHTYTTGGDYLISCTVTDNEDVSNTKWAYFQIPFTCDRIGEGLVDMEDFIPIAQNWLSVCSEPSWCEDTDFNQSGRVDIWDWSIFSNCWLSE